MKMTEYYLIVSPSHALITDSKVEVARRINLPETRAFVFPLESFKEITKADIKLD
jgi:hypothetical protein